MRNRKRDRRLLATAFVFALSAPAICTPPSSAQADEPTEAQSARAAEVCESFAELVTEHAAECSDLGEALSSFIDEHEPTLGMFVGLQPKALEPICMPHIEPAVAPIMACVSAPEVAGALVRLRDIHDEARAVARADDKTSFE